MANKAKKHLSTININQNTKTICKKNSKYRKKITNIKDYQKKRNTS